MLTDQGSGADPRTAETFSIHPMSHSLYHVSPRFFAKSLRIRLPYHSIVVWFVAMRYTCQERRNPTARETLCRDRDKRGPCHGSWGGKHFMALLLQYVERDSFGGKGDSPWRGRRTSRRMSALCWERPAAKKTSSGVKSMRVGFLEDGRFA